MEIAFKRNGRLYNQSYAWVPTRTTSGTWLWLTLYYTRESRANWLVLTPLEFLIDSSHDQAY